MRVGKGLVRKKGYAFLLLLVLAVSAAGLLAKDPMDRPSSDPEVSSLFPLAGRPGTSVEAEIRGKRLEGAYAVWFASQGLKASVKKVEEVSLEEKKEDGVEEEAKEGARGHRVLVQFQIDTEARIGAHSLRLVSQRGLSNALSFWVHTDPVVREIETPHDEPDKAQRVSVPVVLNGKISKSGELDRYKFDALKGQELVFEHEGAGSPTLYEAVGSWFDPNRVTRLEFIETKIPTQYLQQSEKRSSYRFSKNGLYLVKVSGEGGPDSFYRLRIAPIEEANPRGFSIHPLFSKEVLFSDSGWQEQNFIRKVGPEWLEQLWSRTIAGSPDEEVTRRGESSLAHYGERRADGEGSPASPILVAPTIAREREPNETEAQALEASVPTVLEGTIDRPGDIDTFRFRVKEGERLAFEIETPAAGPPRFNPRLAVLDGNGREVFTNIYKRIPSQSMIYWKSVQPKTIYTFAHEGEYVLQLRDVTSRKGEADFHYRVLIRPQIPHVGETHVAEIFSPVQLERSGYLTADRINLVPGEAKKLTVATNREEGFAGDIVVMLEDLPPGVEAFPGTEVEPPEGGSQDKGREELFQPKMQKVTVILLARKTAPITAMPHLIRISLRPIGEGRVGRYYRPDGEDYFRPVVLGRVGRSLPVREIPLMVIRSEAGTRSGASGSSR